MPNVYFAGLFAVLILAAVAGIYEKGGNDREAKVTAAYATRDLQGATVSFAKYQKLDGEYRAQEGKWQKSFATTGAKLQQERVARERAQKDLNAALVAGSLVLRDPGARDNQACGSQAAATSSSTSGSNAGTGSEFSKETSGVLSIEASQFLVGLTAESDAVVNQLTACQQVLTDERK